ncbi:MAG: hypothetical protein PVI86_10390 [Phycisphaerae bacterium]|jgi:hypothetical protein
MPDYSRYQKELISRYYDHRDTILLNRLQEIVTDLFLADSDAKRSRHWSRASKAMESLRVPRELREHILKRADPEMLARNVRDWLSAAKSNAAKPSKS